MVTPPGRSRADVLRACLSLTAGWPVVILDETRELLLRRLTTEDLELVNSAQADDFALLGACLALEQELFNAEFATLEHLLTLCQFEEGALDERIRALPRRAFATAVLDLYALGWVTSAKGVETLWQ